MKLSARFKSCLFKVLVAFLVLSMAGCASVPEDEPASVSPVEDDLSAEYNQPRLIGFIIDPAGNPVAYAEVGGEDIATEDGVASGDFLAYQGGWIPVGALGYASGYAKAFAEDQDFPFFVTRLTPYQSMAVIADENPLALIGFYQDEIYLSADIALDMFQGPSPVVGLAAMDPHSVSPHLAPFPDGEGLRLRSAFALEAFDGDWNQSQLNSGATIPVTLEMSSPLSEQAAFARFDPAAGEWQTVDLGCEKGEGNLYTCQLDFLDPLIGIFDQPETLTAGVAHSPREASALLQEESNPWDDLDEAVAALEDWIDAQEGGINPSHPDLIKLVKKVTDIAMQYAKKNRNESGKSMLADAAPHAMATGQADLSKAMTDEMADIATEIAENALKQTDCGEYRKMIKAAEQIQALKQDFSLADQIMEKVKELVVDCDLWTGTIRVRMPISSTHPSGLDLDSQNWGSWYEIHTVKISTNVKTHAMYGEGKVALSFPDVTYMRSEPCPKVIQISSSSGDSWVVFKGLYDGYNFYIHEMGPEGSGSSINQYWRTEAKQEGKCEVIRENNFSFTPFYSLILHGVSSDSPPISYYEILDSGAAEKDSNGLESFSDQENITNPNPDMGVFPFLEGQVWWRFHHTNWVLPLKNE